jgi:hypothetical protein
VISLSVIFLTFIVLFLLDLVEDMVIGAGVSSILHVGGFSELFIDAVSGFNMNLECLRPCTNCCGTRMSDSPIRAL